MKVRNIIITVAVLGAVTAGSIVTARHFGVSTKSSVKVNVAPVSQVNVWWWDDESQIEGNVISRDVQNVELNNDYDLTKVYVKPGDTVKVGDPLLEYDMSMLQLKLEVEELNGQRLELELSRNEKNLEKTLKSPGAAAIYAKIEKSTEASKTKSPDEEIAAEEADFYGDDVIDEEGDGGDVILSQEGMDYSDQSDVSDDSVSFVDDTDDGNIIEVDMDELIEDDNPDYHAQDQNDNGDSPESDEANLGDLFDAEQETEMDDLTAKITEFLTKEEFIREFQYSEYLETGDISVLDDSDIEYALAIFEDELAAKPSKERGTIQEFTDAFDEKREEKQYVLSSETIAVLDELEREYAGTDNPFYSKDAQVNLYKAYLNLLSYDMIVKNSLLDEELEASGIDIESVSPEEADEEIEEKILLLSDEIRDAADAYYRFDVNRKLLLSVLEKKYDLSEEKIKDLEEEYDEIAEPYAGSNLMLGDSSEGSLSKAIGLLVLETEPVIPDSFDEYSMLRMRITEFLTLEELVRKYQYSAYLENGDISELNERDISDALSIFENELAAVPSWERGTIQEFTDAFGQTREVKQYVLSSDTIAALDELEAKYRYEAESEGTDIYFYSKNAQANLYKAYLNLLTYDMIVKNNKLNQAMAASGIDPDTATAEQIESLRTEIYGAADAYYRFDVNQKLILSILDDEYEYSDEEIGDLTKEFEGIIKPFAGSNLILGDTSEGSLSKLIGKLNDTDIVQETEPVTETEVPKPKETEAVTENYGDYDDYGDDYYGDDDDEEDEETLEETIRNYRTAVVETKLSIRENKLKVKEYKRKLSGQTVKATMNGIVKSAGTVSQPSADDYFIVISGEKGMYVEGTVSELELETIKIGDKVTGSSWGGESFTATITEISEYPQNESGGYMYYGYGDSGNTNVSRYPFTAYIEEDVDLDEGYITMQFVSDKSQSAGIALENQFIRTDEQGRDYVMKADENGLLKKQIVTTAPMPYMDSDSQQIKSGLTLDDRIAFPYGKGVVEGAQTVEAESLDDLYVQ